MLDRDNSSRFRWVRRVGNHRYQARPWYNGVHVNLGNYDTEEEAWFVIRKWTKTNHKYRPIGLLPKYVHRRGDRYYARKSFLSRKVYLGPFQTPEQADRAMREYLADVFGEDDYLEAAYREECKPKFQPAK